MIKKLFILLFANAVMAQHMPLAYIGTTTNTLKAAMTTQPGVDAYPINVLIKHLRQDSIWSTLTCLQVYAQAVEQAAKLNWVIPGTFTAASVNSPTFTPYAGYAGNGTSSYINTEITPSSINIGSFKSMAHGIYQQDNTTCNCVNAGTITSTDYTEFAIRYNGSNDVYPPTNNHNINSAFSGITNASGFFIGNRTDSLTNSLGVNGAIIGSQTVAAQLANNRSYFIGARNNNGSPDFFAPQQISAFFIGNKLTSTMIANFSTHLNNYLKYYGKNVY